MFIYGVTEITRHIDTTRSFETGAIYDTCSAVSQQSEISTSMFRVPPVAYVTVVNYH